MYVFRTILTAAVFAAFFATASAAPTIVDPQNATWKAGTGPIAKRYHIRGYPQVFILDARGVIRGHGRGDIEAAVDKLLAEMKQPTSGQGTSRPGSDKDVTPGP